MSHVQMVTLAVFDQVRDFRDPRGKRHPLPAILSLVFLGLLARVVKWPSCSAGQRCIGTSSKSRLVLPAISLRMPRRSAERWPAVRWQTSRWALSAGYNRCCPSSP